MVRVAALYDVHGNAPALEAVLSDARLRAVDLIVFGGDVAAGPLPAATLALLRRLEGARFVRGNADRELHGWPLAQLAAGDRDFLAGFEESVVIDVDGLGATRFCHGSPRSDMEMLTAATPDDRLRRAVAGVEERVVVCGHTHVQFDRTVDGVRVVNAGSVGMPYERAPGAYWALLGPDVELVRTDYDLEAAAARIRTAGWDEGERFAAENVLTTPSPEEATEFFERQAAAGGPD